MMPDALIIYLLLGVCAGILAGLLGVGGGLIIVPVLAWVFTLQGFPAESLMHLAIGTSLSTIVFTSISSVHAHHRHAAVNWSLFRMLTPGLLLGSLLGSFAADLIPTALLRQIFGVFELVVAAQMGLSLLPASRKGLSGWLGNGIAGGGIGFISAIVGVGGGSMTVPWLVWSSVAMRKAIATSAACGLPIAVAGSAGFMLAGWQQDSGLEWTLGYIYLPAMIAVSIASVALAPVGAMLAHRLPAAQLKRIFALLLLMLGIKMLW